MTQRLKTFAMAATLAAGVTAASPAQARSPMTEAEMADKRAGIMTPLGYEVGVGAVVRTYVDGALALESRLTWAEGGLMREHTIGQPTAGAQAAAARLGLNLDQDWIGLVLENPDGFTAVLNRFTNDGIGNLIVNTAADQDIRLETELLLDIPELERFQQQFQTEQNDMRIQDAIANALTNAVP
ncbi:hypothetical protein [Phenylobacterium sp.]|jgi:hypothetical protein|uniref:hypothetical protein n=1 Tax=Phenylobacterium sp. TaxID=1871053 RepID=UPI002E35466D|nr:hypothetical protein [Phenylobacterium sp.]HEX2561657.1 hypothetical protein [Phenylobacterium sp.]